MKQNFEKYFQHRFRASILLLIVSLMTSFECQFVVEDPNTNINLTLSSTQGDVRQVDGETETLYLEDGLTVHKMDISDLSNPTIIGTYTMGANSIRKLQVNQGGYDFLQDTAFDIYIYNSSSLQLVGQVAYGELFRQIKYIESVDKYVISGKISGFGYFNRSDLPNINPTYFLQDTGGSTPVVKTSPNGLYMACHFSLRYYVAIYDSTTMQIVHNLTTAYNKALSLKWTPDSKYLIIYGRQVDYFDLVRISTWEVETFNTGFVGIKSYFYLEEEQAIIYTDDTNVYFTSIKTGLSNQTNFSLPSGASMHQWEGLRVGFRSSDRLSISVLDVINECPSLSDADQNSAMCQDCGSNCTDCVKLQCYEYLPSEPESESSENNESSETHNQTQDLYEIGEVFNYCNTNLIYSDTIRTMNRQPISRQIFKFAFTFFINFDKLWLYMYHKRLYSVYMSRLFASLRALEEEKWNTVPSQYTESFLDIEQIEGKIQRKQEYINPYFIEAEEKNRSFFVLSIDYFLFNVPLVLASYLALRWLFNRLRNHKLSLLFRKYCFSLFLFVILIEGNIEYFTYIFASDLLNAFSFSFSDKVQTCVTILLFGVFLIFVSSFLLLAKTFYGKKVKYFTDNFLERIKPILVVTFTFVLSHVLSGFAHLVLENHYFIQLGVLALLQTLLCVVLVYSLRVGGYIRLKTTECFNILTALLRICLIITFSFEYGTVQSEEEQNLFSLVQAVVLIVYICAWILSSVFNFVELLISVVSWIAPQTTVRGEATPPVTDAIELNTEQLASEKSQKVADNIFDNIQVREQIQSKKKKILIPFKALFKNRVKKEKSPKHSQHIIVDCIKESALENEMSDEIERNERSNSNC